MSREIKFRAWNGEKNHMITESSKECRSDSLSKGELFGISPFGYDSLIRVETLNGPNFAWKEGLILMQYTGLKDKNGKEIYEGDILADKGVIAGVVKFGDYKMRDFTKNDRQHNHLGWYVGEGINNVSLEYMFYNLTENYSITKDKNYIEIIGNIHEDKHLLDK